MLFDLRLDDHTKDKRIRRHLSKEKFYDTWSAILAFLGWAWELGQCFAYYAQITETELFTTVIHKLEGGSYSILKYEIVFMDRNESSVLLFLRILVTISTVLLLYCVCLRYYHVYKRMMLEAEFYKKLMPGPKWVPPELKLKNKVTMWLILELFYLSIHSLPHVNANFEIGNQSYWLEYSLDLMIFVAMQGRVYLLIRLVKHYSPWFGLDADLVCKTQFAPGGYVFGCKALLKQMPIKFVLYIMIFTTLIGSVAMMLLEEPYQYTSGQDWGNYINAMWCGFNLMAQVGYGDMYPDTHAGRTSGLVVLFAGQFFTSLMIMVITTVASFNKNEENAYHKIVEVFQQEAFLKANKDAIKYGLLYFLEVKIKKQYMSHHRLYTKLQLTLSQCRYLRRAIQLQEIQRPFNFHLQIKKYQLNEKKFDVIRAIRKVETLVDRLASIEKKMDYIEEVTSSLHHSNSLIFQALEAVKDETTVEQPFDGLVACPKALRHIDKLKKIKKLYWLAPTDPEIGIKDLQEGRSMVNLEQKLRRRLVRRITNAQTMVDKELIHLTNDKTIPTLTFHDKRELVTIQDAKENLRRYVEQKKLRMDSLQPKKRNYVSGPQLMDKLRKKAHLVKLSLRMRTKAMQSLAHTNPDEYYNNLNRKEDSSEMDTSSQIKSDQTSENPMGSTAATNPAYERRSVGAYDKYDKEKHIKDAVNVLNLLKEEDEDSVLDSDLDQEDEGDGSSFQDTQNDSSNPESTETRTKPEKVEDVHHKKSVLKLSKYGKVEPPKPEKLELNTQKSILSFSPDSQALVFGDKRLSLGSEIFGKSEGEIKELVKALNVITKNQGSLEDLGSVATLGEFKKILDELDSTQKKHHPGAEKALKDIEYQRQRSRVERSPTIFDGSPSRLDRKISEFVLPEREDVNTNMTLITQENELFPKESDKDHGSRYFAYPTDSTKRRETTEEDNPGMEFGNREPLHRRGYGTESPSPGLQMGYQTEERPSGGRFSQYSGQILGLGFSKSNPSLALLQARKNKELGGISPMKKFSTDVRSPELEFSPALRRKTIGPAKEENSPGEQDNTFGRINLIRPDRQESQTSIISDLQTQQGDDVNLNRTRPRGQSMWSFLKPT